jgi:hypothetical protein
VRALFFIKPCKYCARRSEPVEKLGNLPPSERKIVTKETHQGCLSFAITGFSELIPKPVKKLEKLFIAPKVRQVLYETSQRVFTRCACAQRTGFLINFFNQESVLKSSEKPHATCQKGLF